MLSIWWGVGDPVGACHCPSAAVGSREFGVMSESPECSDVEDGSTSGGEYFDHGAAGDQCTGGAALFAAIRGSAAAPACRQQQHRARRAVAHLLREAAVALSQDAGALCQDAGAFCQGPLPAAKAKRQSVLVVRSRDIAAGYLLERDVAGAQQSRYWAAQWAMREHPDMCRTTADRELFLKNVRRWAKMAKKGAYGLVAGIVVAGDSALGSERVAWGESGQGSCNATMAPSKRRRLRGGGGPGVMKVPCIGEELFAWFVDTLTNIKGRLPSCLLLHRAELITKDLLGIHQMRIETGSVPPHATLDLPAISYGWLRRWRRVYGVSARQANLRYKAPRRVILRRLRVFWCNVIRVRFLHFLLEFCGELVFEGFDQKPLWFTASSQEKTLALRGSRKVVVKENVPMTRARFTAMTRCRWPTPPEDGKELAVLFKAAGGGSRIRETLRVPPEVLLQFQEKGSYRLPDVLAYVSWILDRSRASLAGGPAPPGPTGGDGPPPLIDDDDDGSPAASGQDSASAAASGQDSASAAASGQDSASPGPPFGRRVVYLLDWFAPHLDPSVDALIHGAGHAVLRVGGHLTGLVQVEDTHAHGPMTKIYKKQESLEAHEQLTLRPDKLPSTSRQTVLNRALDSWRAVNHEACSRGFVSNGIANALDGTEDGTLTLDVQGYWAELQMPQLRTKVMAEVAKMVAEGEVRSFDDYPKILEACDVHAAMLEGQEAFGHIIVDGAEEVADATDDDNGDTDQDDDDDDGGPPGGGDGLGGGGHEDPPPPPGERHDGGAEPDYPPPFVPPRDPPHSGTEAAAAATPAASSQAIATTSGVTLPFMVEAARQVTEPFKRQKMCIETALQAVASIGGDRTLEDTLRRRLRDVVKKLQRSGDETRTCLRALALERHAKVEVARAEHKAEEAREKDLKLLVELRKCEADIARSHSKEASLAAKAALEIAKEQKAEAARLRAKAVEDDRTLRVEFAAALVGQLDVYLREGPVGQERRERCLRIALSQARCRAGLQKLDVPNFWNPINSGLRHLTQEGTNIRLRGKSEVLYASPDFAWVLLGRQKFSKEGKWTAGNEPRYAFRCLVDRLMPGYFDLLGGRYGIDNLLTECRSILDLAFVAANWRYTKLVDQRCYRCGLAAWPPVEAWWTSKLSSATAAGPASSQAAVALPSPSVAASSPAVGSTASFAAGAAASDPAEVAAGSAGPARMYHPSMQIVRGVHVLR